MTTSVDPQCSSMDAREIERLLERLALEIAAVGLDPARTALVGIQTRGVTLARRLQTAIALREGIELPLGILDITFYRDDFDQPRLDPIVRDTDITFDITGRRIILVDDVLHTGRTIRAALDALVDFGRPGQVELAVLIDRPGRELPIAPTYVGRRIETRKDEVVQVRLAETDGGEESVRVACIHR